MLNQIDNKIKQNKKKKDLNKISINRNFTGKKDFMYFFYKKSIFKDTSIVIYEQEKVFVDKNEEERVQKLN